MGEQFGLKIQLEIEMTNQIMEMPPILSSLDYINIKRIGSLNEHE